MEIYTDGSNRRVTLSVPVSPIPGTLQVFVYSGGVQVHEVGTVTADAAGLYFNLPFSLLETEKELEVRWVFEYVEDGEAHAFQRSVWVDVVTPILPLTVVLGILGEGFDLDDALTVEHAVRHVIQAHTGQTFGRFVGPKVLFGHGDSTLRLPARLITMNSINGLTSWPKSVMIDPGGWRLNATGFFAVPPVKADFYGINEATVGNSGVPITSPSTKRGTFLTGNTYEIDGEWGWNYVPSQVAEAASLLINDYACADITYRDRFLTSMTAADWRIQFHEGAFANTGNVRANQLLEAYVVKHGWVAV